MQNRASIVLELLVSVSIIFLAVVIAVAFYPYGQLGLTYDSYDLMAASKNLDTYLNGTNPYGYSYLVRAPLHPFVLSFFSDKTLAMWWINLTCVLTSLFLIYSVARLCNLSQSASLGAMTVTGIFVPWLVNFEFLWTEPVFIVLVLLLSVAFLKKGNVLTVTVLCIALFLTRKAGIFFFVAAAALYLFERKRIAAITVLISGTVVFLIWEWIEFTYHSTGYLAAWLPQLQVYERIHYLDAATSWFLPLRMSLPLRVVVMLLIVTIVFLNFRSQIFSSSRERQNVVLLMLAGGYSITLIAVRGTLDYEDGARYLSIVFPFYLILIISVVAKILEQSGKMQRIFILSGTGLWLIYISLRTVHHFFWPVV